MLRRSLLILALGIMAGAAAGAAHAQEREWSLDAGDEEAYLIFGVADTDDVGVSLWCPIGKGVVHLYLPVPTSQIKKSYDKAAPLAVTAGKETATFRGKVDINREADVSSLEAEIAFDNPLISALRAADRFTVTSDALEVIFPLYDADVEGLLEFCRKR